MLFLSMALAAKGQKLQPMTIDFIQEIVCKIMVSSGNKAWDFDDKLKPAKQVYYDQPGLLKSNHFSTKYRSRLRLIQQSKLKSDLVV